MRLWLTMWPPFVVICFEINRLHNCSIVLNYDFIHMQSHALWARTIAKPDRTLQSDRYLCVCVVCIVRIWFRIWLRQLWWQRPRHRGRRMGRPNWMVGSFDVIVSIEIALSGPFGHDNPIPDMFAKTQIQNTSHTYTYANPNILRVIALALFVFNPRRTFVSPVRYRRRRLAFSRSARILPITHSLFYNLARL